jgi:cyclophilin family peptidyl-prolyl cis-trans isomerase
MFLVKELPMPLKMILAALAALLFAGAAPAQTPLPQAAPDLENIWLLDLSTGGRVAIQLRPDLAPRHVERIKTLTRQNFYNGLLFHRVIEGFMAQGGDPEAPGRGGSPLPDLAAEFNVMPHLRGVVSMARAADLNSANSQFFIMLAPRLSLDRQYTAFGRVISGMIYVDAIEKGEPPANPARILRASIAADNIPPPVAGQPIPTFSPNVAAAPPAGAGPPQPAQPTPQN